MDHGYGGLAIALLLDGHSRELGMTRIPGQKKCLPSASKRVLHLHSTIEASRVMTAATTNPENPAPPKNGTSTPTVMLKGIFEQVAEGQNVSKKQAHELLAHIFAKFVIERQDTDKMEAFRLAS
jgi:hypothetical protein